VPFASAWLIWHRRRLLESLQPRVWWPGLLAITAASMLWLLADLADVDALRQVAVIATLQAVVVALLGKAMARALALPLLYLFFAVDAFLLPLAPPLLSFSAWLGVAMLRACGLAVALHGLTIATSFGKWLMTDNCSGVEYMAVYAMAALLFASLAYRSTGRRVALVLAALGAALLANGLRVWAIVFAAYVNGGVDLGHEVIGWLAFATPLAIVLAVASRFADPPDEVVLADAGAPLRGPLRDGQAANLRSSALAALAAIGIVGAAPAWTATRDARAGGIEQGQGCRVVARETVQRDGASLTRTRTVCVGAAGRRQLLGAPLLPLDGVAPDSIRARATVRVIEPGHQGAIPAIAVTTLDGPVPYRLTYWYEVGGYATGSRVAMKLRLALALLQDRETPVTVVCDLQDLRDTPRP
jgi:exosortase